MKISAKNPTKDSSNNIENTDPNVSQDYSEGHVGRINNYLIKSIQFIIKWLYKLISWLSGAKENTEYFPLTPNEKAEKVGEYCIAMKKALLNYKIDNIAVTGPYSSGKSSFLNTFQIQNPQWNYLTISLATFDEEKSNNDILEKRILKQLFYQADSVKIPHSRYQRIEKTTYFDQLKLVVKSLLISYAFVFMIWMIFPSVFKPFFKSFECDKINPIFLCQYTNWIIPASWFFFLGIVTIIIYQISKYYRGRVITKINIAKIEMDSKRDDSKSIFDENLDEILYFFSSHKYNVVIIEDMDRFPSLEIFTKFRELNKLINSQSYINNTNHIKFIYAIKDDLLKSKNKRVKFFDFIIPIIPYINPSNSYDILLKIFNNEIKKGNLSKALLDEIAIHIHDNRLLFNIYNEYFMYKANVSPQVDNNKLLAMIVYKNYHQNDFAELHLNKGNVYKVFSNLEKRIHVLLNKYNEELSIIIEKIDEREKFFERLTNISINELQTIYLSTIFKKLNTTMFFANNVQYQLFSDGAVDFDNLINCDNFLNQHKHSYNISFEDIELEINPEYTYVDRNKIILDKVDSKVEKLKIEKDDIKLKIEELEIKTVREMLQDSSAYDEILGHINCSLLKVLISKGYIAEDYYSSISYFFKNAITLNDNDFLLSLSNEKPLGFRHQLNSFKELMKRLHKRHFHLDSILNFSLFKYLLENKSEYFEFYDLFISKLADESDASINFVFSETSFKEKYIHAFLKQLISKWNLFWKVFEDSNPSMESLKKYLKLVVNKLDIESIKIVNVDGTLSRRIENIENLNVFDKSNYDHHKEILSELKIKMHNLYSVSDNLNLFEYIYKNNHYEINKKMIKFIVRKKVSHNIEHYIHRLAKSNFTTIKNLKLNHMIEYIESHIEYYIKNVFLTIQTNTDESNEIVLDLLNNENIEINYKVMIIEQSTFVQNEISEIKLSKLWDSIFEHRRVAATWSNLICYFKNNNDFTIELKHYLNEPSVYSVLSKEHVNYYDGDDNTPILIRSFSKEIIQADWLSDQAYKSLINSIQESINDINFKNLNDFKINALLDYKLISFTQENLDSLRNYSDAKLTILIENHIDSLLENYDNYLLLVNDFIRLLNSKSLTSKQIIDLINITNSNEFSEDESSIFSKKVFEFVKKSNAKLKLEVFDHIFNHLDNVENQVQILAIQINYLESNMVVKYLSLLPSPYSELCCIGKAQPKILINDVNYELLGKLKSMKIISSFDYERRNNPQHYRVRLFNSYK